MDVSSTALFEYLSDDLRAAGYSQDSPDSDFWPGATPRDVAMLRLERSLLKKLSDSVAPDADKLCYDKFLQSNQLAGDWRLNFKSSWEEVLFGEFRNSLDDFFYPDGEPLVQSFMDIAIRARLGPGASVGANGEDFYTKLFSSRLTCTSFELYQWYNEYIGWWPDWRDAEISRHITFGPPRIVRGNLLSFVRKTSDISRSICTEPSLNMFFQLGLGEIISERLKSRFRLDLSDQQGFNRQLACRGSLDDSVSTLDLESASDSISLAMCEATLPEFLLDLLYMLRSPVAKVGADEVRLNMVSTMGNGFTFPLMTTIMACVVSAAARCRGVPLSSRGPHLNWGVFGDDIICPKEISADVVSLLNLLGFRVNSRKSYFVGPFRESCGGDFYMGVNVRGVYLKSLLTQESRYVAINLLNEWVARHGVMLCRTIGYLVDSVRYLAIPVHSPPDAGIRVPFPPEHSYRSKHQRYYYRQREVVMPVLNVRDGFLTITPRSARKRWHKRFFNPLGLEIAFRGGYVENMSIPLRLKQGEEPTYRTVVRVSPYWGPDQHQLAIAGELFWHRWSILTGWIGDTLSNS